MAICIFYIYIYVYIVLNVVVKTMQYHIDYCICKGYRTKTFLIHSLIVNYSNNMLFTSTLNKS